MKDTSTSNSSPSLQKKFDDSGLVEVPEEATPEERRALSFPSAPPPGTPEYDAWLIRNGQG